MLSVSFKANKFTRICLEDIYLGYIAEGYISVLTGVNFHWYMTYPFNKETQVFFSQLFFFRLYFQIFFSVPLLLVFFFRNSNHANMGSFLPVLYGYHFLLSSYLPFLFYFLKSSYGYPLYPCCVSTLYILMSGPSDSFIFL